MELTNIYYIHYGDNIPFYIGKTINIKDRKNNHRRKFKKTIFLEIIDEIPTNEWKFWEKHYISLFKSWGFMLENKNNGGGGCDLHPEHVRLSISKNKKINGYKDNELRKKRISIANKGISNPMKGKSQPIEYIYKRSQSNKKPCLQIRDGIIIKEWNSSTEANNVFKGANNALNGRAKTAHGYVWKYKK